MTSRCEIGLLPRQKNTDVFIRFEQVYLAVDFLLTDLQIDQMGNIFAIRSGENNQLPPIAIGSHLDTQPKGGKYDGILGQTIDSLR